jgi:hypothetical protein
LLLFFLVRTSSNQFWADTTTPGWGGAPPVRQTIPLRSIVCLTGGLGLRSLLQTKIYTTDLDATAGVNWAPMFYQDNVITQTVGIAANNLNASYEINFDYGTAVYGTAQAAQRTTADDSLLVQVLRADNSVLTSTTYAPGAWDTVGTGNLDAGLKGTLSYIGDGTGVVRLRIGPAGTLNSLRFEGEIDNLSVSLIPEPGAALLGGLGLLTLLRRRR